MIILIELDGRDGKVVLLPKIKGNIIGKTGNDHNGRCIQFLLIGIGFLASKRKKTNETSIW
ncbi:hypothetical protein Ct9H90mP29_23080 [bacterium]|nr:MAG: hypothetical protein Ct9H90mP29_23080 [bacterium]